MRARTRKLLVVAQLAIAVVLLVGAGLLLRSVRTAACDRSRVRCRARAHAAHGAVVRIVRRRRSARRRFYDAVVERVRRCRVSRSAGFVTFLPLTFEGLGGGVAIESRPVPKRDSPVSARFRMVTHDYLRASGVRSSPAARSHASDTAESPRVAVVSESFARRSWDDDHHARAGPAGQDVRFARHPRPKLAHRGRHHRLRRQSRLDAVPPLDVYSTRRRAPVRVRRASRPRGPRLIGRRRSAVAGPRSRDHPRRRPRQPVTDVRLLADIVRHGTADRRVYLWVLGAFAALTLALAALRPGERDVVSDHRAHAGVEPAPRAGRAPRQS